MSNILYSVVSHAGRLKEGCTCTVQRWYKATQQCIYVFILQYLVSSARFFHLVLPARILIIWLKTSSYITTSSPRLLTLKLSQIFIEQGCYGPLVKSIFCLHVLGFYYFYCTSSASLEAIPPYFSNAGSNLPQAEKVCYGLRSEEVPDWNLEPLHHSQV